MKWIDFPKPCFEVRGLPWFEENAPALWRLPGRAKGRVREPVWNLARFPSGGRVRFSSDTSQLSIRVDAAEGVPRRNMSAFGSRGFDVYVNGVYWSSAGADVPGEAELQFFEGADRSEKEVTIYLPLFQEVRVLAIAVDGDAWVVPPRPFSRPLPVVFYGSSVAQGSGACRPGMAYGAILGRRADLDCVNLGFGGNGRGEPEAVSLVNEIDACCYVFDLGKSYGMQPEAVYAAMLETVRSSHPEIPAVCITPIFSTREFYDAEYRDLSRHTREVARRAATQRIRAGDRSVHLVEGQGLLGADDADGFHEGVHPTDYGFQTIAGRLRPAIERALKRGRE